MSPPAPHQQLMVDGVLQEIINITITKHAAYWFNALLFVIHILLDESTQAGRIVESYNVEKDECLGLCSCDIALGVAAA